MKTSIVDVLTAQLTADKYRVMDLANAAIPHSKHLLPYGVVTRKSGESSNNARLRHGRYKNVERPPVNVGHGEQVCM